MKQVAQNYRSGDLSVLDVPTPHCHAGGVLVHTLCFGASRAHCFQCCITVGEGFVTKILRVG